MGSVFRMLMRLPLMRPLLRPLTRFLVGALAIPLFRVFLKRVVRLQDLDAELEKDLEQWFRASLVLLVATRNMESYLFDWVPVTLQSGDWWNALAMGLRLMLAVSVVELMPDQELFSVIHPGPPKLDWTNGIRRELLAKRWEIAKGMVNQHLNRSSPVFAILTAILPGTPGWVCYTMAVAQYLVIGLVTSKDKAMDALSEFDRQVARRRRELVEEFHLGGSSSGSGAPEPADPRAFGASGTDRGAETPRPIVAKEAEPGYESE